MPLQQISLDQSIYNKPKWSSNVQQSQPQNKSRSGQLPLKGSINAPNSFVEKQKAEWAAEDKAKKAERDMQMQKLQEVGARTLGQAQQQQQQVAQQQAEMKAKVEENPEPFAEEQWKFFLSLDEEGQKRFTDQIFASSPQQSTINGQPIPSAKTKYAGGVIADYWIEKGYVMFDPKGNVVVNKPEYAEGDEWVYNAEDNLMYNKRTGKSKPRGDMEEKDWDVIYQDIVKSAQSQVKDFLSETFLEGLSPEQRNSFAVIEQEKMQKIIEARLWQAGMTDATKIENWAAAAVGDFDWEGALAGKTTTSEGDMALAYRIYDYIKGKGDISEEEKQYNIDTYGAETWAIVERKLAEDEAEKKKIKPVVKQEEKPVITPKAKSKPEPKKTYTSPFNKWSPL